MLLYPEKIPQISAAGYIIQLKATKSLDYFMCDVNDMGIQDSINVSLHQRKHKNE